MVVESIEADGLDWREPRRATGELLEEQGERRLADGRRCRKKDEDAPAFLLLQGRKTLEERTEQPRDRAFVVAYFLHKPVDRELHRAPMLDRCSLRLDFLDDIVLVVLEFIHMDMPPCEVTDVIFSYFIENKIYDMIELDIQLEEHGEKSIIA